MQARWALDCQSLSGISRSPCLGGRWSTGNTQPYDYVRAQTNSDIAREWARHFGLPTQASFGLGTYSAEEATFLSQMWARKMDWLLKEWLFADEDPNYVYTPATIAMCPFAVAADLPATASTRARARARAIDRLPFPQACGPGCTDN